MASELNEMIFDDFVKDGTAVVDFYADWCGPCKAAAPVLADVEKCYGNKIRMGKVNVDESRGLAIKFAVESIPTVVIFKNGTEAERIVGLRSFDEYCGIIDGIV